MKPFFSNFTQETTNTVNSAEMNSISPSLIEDSTDLRNRKQQYSAQYQQQYDDDKYQKYQGQRYGIGPYTTSDFIDSVVDGIMRYDYQTTATAFAITLISLISRLINIHKGNFVIWDEAHFGKFASFYLKREFYFDVHPPLGKIIVGFAGLLANYHGDFDFESGRHYPDHLNYWIMRIFLALFGVFMAPLAYLTLRELQVSHRAAIFAAICVICDNAFLTISRYILLDSMLLFFTVFTVYSMAVFHNVSQRYPSASNPKRGGFYAVTGVVGSGSPQTAFTGEWWFWLCMTGFGIGCVSSVKWVGFFVTALVGLYTIEDLWAKFGDVKMSQKLFWKHFFARVVGLIIIPISVYIFSFWLHFGILIYSGSGDAQMSSLFQAQLIGNHFHENPLNIAYGSRVTLKNNGYGGGLLHSHVQTFPHGSKQQQITIYHHKDSNNDWEIKYVREHAPLMEEDDPVFLRHGDIVRIVHAQTGRNLHSHPVAGPVTKNAWEVSGYGNETLGDSNDYWQVEIVDDLHQRGHGSAIPNIRSLTTRFRLKHINMKCYLRAHHVTLPSWGFKQGEVVCDKQLKKDVYNMWNVEQHWNDKLPPGSPENYQTSFIQDFIHLNVAMYVSNNALTPDPDKEPDLLTSSPSQWPFLEVGLRMCGWDDSRFKVYLLGNPIIWWSSTISLILFGAIWTLYILRKRRGFADWSGPSGQEEWDRFQFLGKYFLLGWFLHFFPFGIMARVTYLHHYFPALYFAILMLSFMVDHLAKFIPMLRINSLISDDTGPTKKTIVLDVFGKYDVKFAARDIWFGLVNSIVIGVFLFFAPLSYGFTGPAAAYKNRKWVSSWNLYDGQ